MYTCESRKHAFVMTSQHLTLEEFDKTTSVVNLVYDAIISKGPNCPLKQTLLSLPLRTLGVLCTYITSDKALRGVWLMGID